MDPPCAENLLLHAPGWPTAADLDARVFTGQTGYGMAATGSGLTSEVARAIVQREDLRPSWICIWGGANTLASAALVLAIAKLCVYSISDQGDAGPGYGATLVP